MNEKVLVVDDNDANRQMMVDVLVQWGYQVEEAVNGRVVMRLVEECKPDLILLDVMLPGMNGYEICHRLKQDPKTDHIPIIMLTVLSDSESRTRGISVGADLFVSRPPNYLEMHKNIESLLLNKRKYRRMETLEAVCGSLEALVKRLSPSEYERYQGVFGYAKRTAKILGIDDDAQQRMMMGGLCCALERALSDVGRDGPSLADIVAPLNAGSWIERFAAEQRNPSAVDAEDAIAAVYYMCARYCEQRAVGGSDESVLEEVRKHLVGYSARLSVFEALKQAVSDEAFLRRLNEPGGGAAAQG
ncbi:response regulator [Eggerthella sinensis]|uniref:response regulator n=1 Tax=Eggerthella sinensis TaxID=242230 RepID=UPI00266D8873|nr:response regulator [Eggerthella sinensis]